MELLFHGSGRLGKAHKEREKDKQRQKHEERSNADEVTHKSSGKERKRKHQESSQDQDRYIYKFPLCEFFGSNFKSFPVECPHITGDHFPHTVKVISVCCCLKIQLFPFLLELGLQ